jgi:hypothetical protein
MSWGALPYWVYSVDYERFLAECSCCFKDEWHSGYSKEMPMYVQESIQRRKLQETLDEIN